MIYLILVVSLIGIVLGADWLVSGSVSIAKRFRVSEFVIGAAIVGVGTSMPELVVSFIGALQGNSDVAIGNVVGSNIFNVLAILGIAPLIAPIRTQDISYTDMILMAALSILLYPLMKTGMKISRKEGAFLLAVYIAYTVYLIFQ